MAEEAILQHKKYRAAGFALLVLLIWCISVDWERAGLPAAFAAAAVAGVSWRLPLSRRKRRQIYGHFVEELEHQTSSQTSNQTPSTAAAAGSVRTHYDNLRVARDAPPEVIRAAYRALAQKYHPDKAEDKLESGRVMAILNRAYEVLSSDAARRNHDAWIGEQERLSARKTHDREPAPKTKLSSEDIEYLGQPIEAVAYCAKHGLSLQELSQAVGYGKIRGLLVGDRLWVQDIKM